MIATAGLVDFHCHLDLYPNHAAAVQDAEASGVFTLAVTTTPRAWPRNHELAQRTKHVRAALGLHPQLVAERENEIELWDRHLPETRYVGEVGLDAGPRFFKSLDAQKRVFQHVLQQCAQAGGKIITVHSIRSAKAVLDLVETHLPPERGGGWGVHAGGNDDTSRLASQSRTRTAHEACPCGAWAASAVGCGA